MGGASQYAARQSKGQYQFKCQAYCFFTNYTCLLLLYVQCTVMHSALAGTCTYIAYMCLLLPDSVGAGAAVAVSLQQSDRGALHTASVRASRSVH